MNKFIFDMGNYKRIAIGIILMIAAFPSLAVTINTDTTITASDVSYDNQDIIVDAATLTIDGSHTFLDFQLINGAVLTHS
ncbi:MAG: hypothetical protein L3J53_05240 [Proteobacteria bacterium]|nr:hypothetical protein [Pseudomonadota bacterium]